METVDYQAERIRNEQLMPWKRNVIEINMWDPDSPKLNISHHVMNAASSVTGVDMQDTWPVNRSLCKAIRAAHAEGKDWRTELDVFLLAYRSTSHCVTGRSQAKLLFNRQIRTKLPELPESQLQPTLQDAAVRKADAVEKEKWRINANRIRSAKESTVKQGDWYGSRRKTNFQHHIESHPYTAISRTGQSVITEKDGKEIMGCAWTRHSSAE